MEKRHIAILGSTGSIGRQALDVVRQHPDMFEVELLTANNSSSLLISQAIEFNANNVVICNEDKYEEVASALQPHYIKVFAGMQSVCDLVGSDNIDIVLTAMVGFSGLRSTVAAIKAGKTVALANKETLVAAGEAVMDLASRHRTAILGGPFRTWTKDMMARATAEEALRHPKWKMGSKITVDSATMMNKGLEIIEARWLFGTDESRINVVVHPESIIHSMVEYADGTVMAQLGQPDMRGPIQYALGYPYRLPSESRKLDFASLGSISFQAPDPDRFPAMQLAREALRKGGNMPCIMNAANEVAVAAFLQGKTGFYGITDTVERCMNGVDFVENPDLDTIFLTDEAASARAKEILGVN